MMAHYNEASNVYFDIIREIDSLNHSPAEHQADLAGNMASAMNTGSQNDGMGKWSDERKGEANNYIPQAITIGIRGAEVKAQRWMHTKAYKMTRDQAEKKFAVDEVTGDIRTTQAGKQFPCWVMTMSALNYDDPHADRNAILRYDILRNVMGDNGQPIFEIDAESGAVRTSIILLPSSRGSNTVSRSMRHPEVFCLITRFKTRL